MINIQFFNFYFQEKCREREKERDREGERVKGEKEKVIEINDKINWILLLQFEPFQCFSHPSGHFPEDLSQCVPFVQFPHVWSQPLPQ